MVNFQEIEPHRMFLVLLVQAALPMEQSHEPQSLLLGPNCQRFKEAGWDVAREAEVGHQHGVVYEMFILLAEGRRLRHLSQPWNEDLGERERDKSVLRIF